MGRKLYVGNSPYSATEASLRETFSASGTVDSVRLITDRDTATAKGLASSRWRRIKKLTRPHRR